MATDDLVPDAALARRLGMAQEAVEGLLEIARTRKHMTQLPEGLAEIVVGLKNCRAYIGVHGQDDPDQVKYRSRVRKEGFPTYTGVWFYPFDPKPEEVRHDDIVMGLLHNCRYNGQVPRFLSVAEHSVKVAAMAEHLIMLDVRAGRVTEEYAAHAALYALLHDAHEAYLGDIILPIKRCMMHVMGESWEVIEGRVQDAILDAYHLPPPPPEVEEVVALADRFALYCEASVLKSNSDLDRWGLRVPPPDVQAVGVVRREWPEWAKVKALFDGEVRRLVQTVGGHIPESGERPDPATALRAIEKLERKIESGPPPKGTPGSWRNKVASSAMDIPRELRDEPEFKEGK